MSFEDQPPVEPIAIIGMACRFPGAADVRQFWQNLVQGVESVRHFTREEQAALGVPEHMLDDENFVAAASMLDDMDAFDAAFFNIGAREAELRDPQQRVFLELAYTAFEDAGYEPARVAGEVGVYGAIGSDAYQWMNIRRNPRVHEAAGAMAVMVASHPHYLATLTSYKLNLRGPSLTVSTACSSSLVACHLAAEALRNGECEMALAGGVSFELPKGWGYLYDDDGVLSPDGRSRVFDAKASGTIWGSGGGIVVLKRLSDAVDDGDHIYAVILGNAINNDGAGKVGFSAPSVEGQTAAVSQALGLAGVPARSVSYVEAHGTATPLGDPVELAALTNVFARDCQDRAWCGIGSVKTNFGHLGPAAGIAGLIKTALALEHRTLPPSLHFTRPNEKVDFEGSPFYVNARLKPWEANGTPLRAGVSSFGIGGTNAHVLLGQAPAGERRIMLERPVQLLRVSARTEGALREAAARLGTHIKENRQLNLADVEFTLREGRREFLHRAAVVAAGHDDVVAALGDPGRLITGVAPKRPPQVAFLFSGQGAQYPGMGDELYRTEPVYRDTLDLCADLLRGELGEDLGEDLHEVLNGPAERLLQTAFAQPALFAVEYSLAMLWRERGLEPAAMIGHSIGEYVAATLAGVFTLLDALRLVATRGRLMQRMATGSMLAVQLEPELMWRKLPEGLSIAAVNTPDTCVVAGPTPAVRELADRLGELDIGRVMLHTSHAFHSAMMEPILAEFHEAVAGVERGEPHRQYLSNLTGDWIRPEQATDPSYWVRHLRETVQFGQCVGTLLRHGEWMLVECGPGRQLADLARAQTPRGSAPVPSLPGAKEETGAQAVMAAAEAKLWTAGVEFQRGKATSGNRVPLPGYPWERKRYWVEPTVDALGLSGAGQEKRGQRPISQWFQVPSWRPAPPVISRTVPAHCLVFADDDSLVPALRAAGVGVTEVRPGDLSNRDAYFAFVSTLADRGELPDRIVHAWALGAGAPSLATSTAWAAQDLGFFSLLWLCQALAATQPVDPVQLDILSRGTLNITGGDVVRPEFATVAGIVHVLPLEALWLTVRQVDITGGASVESALPELFATPEHDVVALRGDRRWVEGYGQAEVPAAATPASGLRDHGVYLITGGLGGIGITVAEDISRRVKARLVLASRTGLPPRDEWQSYVDIHGTIDRTGRAIAAIRRMEAAGAEVMVVAADATSLTDMRSVREQTLARFGSLDGIIHAAGVAGGGMAEIKTREVAEAVLAPKVLGPLVLREVFGDLRPDFVAVCSSVAGIAGGFGQVDYCAANAFIDAFAHSAHGWPTRLVSIDWSGWAEVGMSAEIAAPEAFRGLQRGERVTPIEHPMLTTLHAGDADRLPWCSGILIPRTQWVLGEHRLDDRPLMPGTGYLELARCGFEAVSPRPAPGMAVELRDVAFVEWLAVPDDTAVEIRVTFTLSTEGLDFEVLSLVGGVQRVHVRGGAAWVSPGDSPGSSIAELRERCSDTIREVSGLSEVSNSGLITFGSRWHSLRTVMRGRDEALAWLHAAEVVAGELPQWGLHPAMLDEATSFGQMNGEYLPIGYGRVLIRGPLPEKMWSHWTYHDSGGGEVVAADLSIMDDGGRETIAITDYLWRRIDPDTVTGTVNRAPVATARPPDELDADRLMRPTDGAEAFHRLIAHPLGNQVSITAVPMDELIPHIREVTQSSVETGLETGAAAADRASSEGGGGQVPTTELEAALARIWGDVLGVDRIGLEDNFFDLGGNSLVAVQLIALVRKTHAIRLPMQKVFDSPTVAGMAALVEKMRADSQAESVAPERPTTIPRLQRPPVPQE